MSQDIDVWPLLEDHKGMWALYVLCGPLASQKGKPKKGVVVSHGHVIPRKATALAPVRPRYSHYRYGCPISFHETLLGFYWATFELEGVLF